MNNFRLLASAAAVGALVLATPRADAATPKDQLVIAMNMTNFLAMDPAEIGQFEPLHVFANVYDGIIRTDPVQENKVLPGIAQSWDFSDNGDIVFHIRKGAKFHSGNDVSAEDVAWSLQRVVKLNLSNSSNFKQWGYTKDTVEQHIFVKDGSDVVMKMVTPINPALKLYVLARGDGSVLDKKEVLAHEKDGDLGHAWLTTNEAGSGPFSLRSWRPNDSAILERFDGYWNGPAKMKRVIIRHMPESQSVRLQLEKGDLDVGYTLSSADFVGLEKSGNVTIQDVPGGGYYYFAMSAKDPDLGKPAVRKALRWCIDYEGINNSVMAHYGVMWRWPIQKGVVGAMAEDLDLHLDVERCKSELAAAGYPNGMEKTLKVITPSPFMEVATAIQATMAKAGVKLKIEPGNGDQVYGAMRNREWQTLVGRGGGGSAPDPHSNMFAIDFNPDNRDSAKLINLLAWRSSWSIPGLSAIVEAAAAEVNEEKRARMYEEAQILGEALGPTVQPISQRIDPFVLRKEVKGYVGHPNWMTRWDQVTKE